MTMLDISRRLDRLNTGRLIDTRRSIVLQRLSDEPVAAAIARRCASHPGEPRSSEDDKILTLCELSWTPGSTAVSWDCPDCSHHDHGKGAEITIDSLNKRLSRLVTQHRQWRALPIRLRWRGPKRRPSIRMAGLDGVAVALRLAPFEHRGVISEII